MRITLMRLGKSVAPVLDRGCPGGEGWTPCLPLMSLVCTTLYRRALVPDAMPTSSPAEAGLAIYCPVAVLPLGRLFRRPCLYRNDDKAWLKPPLNLENVVPKCRVKAERDYWCLIRLYYTVAFAIALPIAVVYSIA